MGIDPLDRRNTGGSFVEGSPRCHLKWVGCSTAILGPPRSALLRFLGGRFPTKIDYRKKGSFILSFLLEDLVFFPRCFAGRFRSSFLVRRWRGKARRGRSVRAVPTRRRSHKWGWQDWAKRRLFEKTLPGRRQLRLKATVLYQCWEAPLVE